MSQSKYSANLSAADFNLSFSFKGHSVIVPGLDQNYFQGTAGWAGDTPQRGINIPQIYYCENTVPTAEGYRSIAYRYFIDPPATPQRFIKIFNVFDGNASSGLVGVTADHKLFAVSAYTGGVWLPLNFPAGYAWDSADQVTFTVVLGSPTFCFKGLGIFVYGVVANELYHVELIGLDETLINGVCSSKGYTIVWDDYFIYWSSTENAWDFTPSLITGAGRTQVEGLKGGIVLCKEIAGGFIIYSDVSIISAAYSSNLNIPWIFDVLGGGMGVKSDFAVSFDINSQTHIAWTSGGLVQVELHQATPRFPQVTDFIASGLADKTITLTDYPVTEYDDVPKEVRLAVISSRYVCISFGSMEEPPAGEFPVPRMVQSFLFDLQLQRWGKLNVDHIQILETPFSARPPVFF